MSECRGCQTTYPGSEMPDMDHCGNCPPRRCADCGQMDSHQNPCPCWISLDGMALADIKGLLALGDFSVTTTTKETTDD